MVESSNSLTPEESQAQEFYSGLVLPPSKVRELIGMALVKADQSETHEDFTCQICLLIVFDAQECTACERIFCLECA